MGIKNAEFYAKYKTVGKNAKMITKKKLKDINKSM